jgi:hypothetical protein
MQDALILFGGELFNGEKCWVYNDLFLFGTKNYEWRKITSQNAPPPRCAHQAVVINRLGGQMWIFGGEFTSPVRPTKYYSRCAHHLFADTDTVLPSQGPLGVESHYQCLGAG